MFPMSPSLNDRLQHAPWAGFHFYDLIFPLFVFIVGVSLVFSLTKTVASGGRAEALKRVFQRGILLFVIGIFYSGGFTNTWPDMRLMGVLNRIALAYFFAGLVPSVVSFHTIATSGTSFTMRSSALFCARLRTQPCSVTNLRVVVTQTLVSRNRRSSRTVLATRSLISGSRL